MNPTDNTTDPTLEESVASVLTTVPAPIREFLTGPSRDQVLRGLTTKYALPLDQAGELERLLILMMLGLVAPEEFVSGLAEAGIAQETIDKLTQELNDLVFQPLQDKIRAQGSEEKATPQGAAAPAPQPKPVAKPMPAPPANLPGVMLPKVPMPVQPKPVAKPVFATSFAANAAPMNAPVAPKPAAHVQVPQRAGLAGALKAAGVPLLEDHEEPSPSLKATEGAAHIDFAKPAAPPPAPAPRVMPTTMPPVQPMPAAPVMPRPAAPAAPVAPMQSTAAPQRPPMPQQTPVKSYAVDPYREQPEEHEK